MAIPESRKRANSKRDKENMTTLGCKIRKEQAADFKAYCEAQGKTSNTVLKDYVLECIDKPHTDALQSVPGIPVPQSQEVATQAVSASAMAILPEKLNQAKAHAEARREPIGGFLARAIDETIERDKNAPVASQGDSEG